MTGNIRFRKFLRRKDKELEKLRKIGKRNRRVKVQSLGVTQSQPCRGDHRIQEIKGEKETLGRNDGLKKI